MATVKLTTEEFKKKVFDYENATEWSYAGELPAIVDFYADWCGPSFLKTCLKNMKEN